MCGSKKESLADLAKIITDIKVKANRLTKVSDEYKKYQDKVLNGQTHHRSELSAIISNNAMEMHKWASNLMKVSDHEFACNLIQPDDLSFSRSTVLLSGRLLEDARKHIIDSLPEHENGVSEQKKLDEKIKFNEKVAKGILTFDWSKDGLSGLSAAAQVTRGQTVKYRSDPPDVPVLLDAMPKKVEVKINKVSHSFDVQCPSLTVPRLLTYSELKRKTDLPRKGTN